MSDYTDHFKETISTALRELSPEHREVIELTYFSEQTSSDIAAVLGISPQTVRMRLFHARRRLRRILEQEGVTRSMLESSEIPPANPLPEPGPTPQEESPLSDSQGSPPHRSPSPLHKPPGHQIGRFVTFFYSERTKARVFDPIIADLQHEYIEALGKGEKWKAGWVRVRGYWGFWKAVGLQTVIGQIVGRILGLFKIN